MKKRLSTVSGRSEYLGCETKLLRGRIRVSVSTWAL
tara:strand:- start:236 stop:343 length:108 start_codon:yes stop_codon:yes gene_type:complete